MILCRSGFNIICSKFVVKIWLTSDKASYEFALF